MRLNQLVFALLICLPLSAAAAGDSPSEPRNAQPNIVLVMADDMGWGQTGYYHHPILKTPNLDSMAAHGLRFDRFYAAGPVCSPTRSSVLTGRSHRRTGVESHGFALRLQEHTIAQALQTAGYATGHFGKWHLNGIRGPGVPILSTDSHRPGVFGFEEWLSVTNFFDRNPIMSRMGDFVEFEGDSSEIIVDEALKFIKAKAIAKQPSFTVIWYGTPHSPFVSDPIDARPFAALDKNSKNHYGELVAMDRSIGSLREGLREIGIAENTLVWFTSDNGGLPKITPETVGGLRGFKGSLYEGGIRVPAILEWPAKIKPRITSIPAVSMDIVPTLLEVVGLSDDDFTQPQDGISLTKLFEREWESRPKPIPFSYQQNTAIIDNEYKLLELTSNQKKPTLALELYNLIEDPEEKNNLYQSAPELAARMTKQLRAWQSSLADSQVGKDYPEGKVDDGQPVPEQWSELEIYRPYFEAWKNRPEYQSRIAPKLKSNK